MKRSKLLTAVASIALLGGTYAFSQDQPNQRGPRDPAQFRQQMETRMKEQLGTNDDEWKVLQPKLEKVMEAQRDARGGGFGFGGRGRGGPGGGGGAPAGAPDARPQSAVSAASSDLRKTLENTDAPADEIKTKLAALRDARMKARTTLESAQKDLKEILTQRQEAVLVTMGMMD